MDCFNFLWGRCKGYEPIEPVQPNQLPISPKNDEINKLSNDLLAYICTYLNLIELSKFALVSKRAAFIVADTPPGKYLWEKIMEKMNLKFDPNMPISPKVQAMSFLYFEKNIDQIKIRVPQNDINKDDRCIVDLVNNKFFFNFKKPSCRFSFFHYEHLKEIIKTIPNNQNYYIKFKMSSEDRPFLLQVKENNCAHSYEGDSYEIEEDNLEKTKTRIRLEYKRD